MRSGCDDQQVVNAPPEAERAVGASVREERPTMGR
jgi:hypothetical protein